MEQLGFEVIGIGHHPNDMYDLPKVDYIFHLASYGNMYQHTDREEIFRANIERTFQLLESTKDMDYKSFVYVSSSSVGLANQTLYSACKKATEALISAYDNRITIVRPYTVTGIGEQKEHLIPTLIDAAFTGKEIDFVSEPGHDFIDVQDVVTAMIGIALGLRYKKIHHIGSGKSYKNIEVLGLVELVTGRKINFREVDSMRSYDTKLWVSSEKWATISLIKIIKEMVKDYEHKE